MTALVVDEVTIALPGRDLLQRFSLSLSSGDTVALLGPNGAGKTTLLRCILGLVQPTSGRTLIDGVETRLLSAKKRAGYLAHLPQNEPDNTSVAVLEYVSGARFRFDETRKANEVAAKFALSQVDADGLVERDLSTLSGGERQRVAMAALLAQDAAIALLDEPASHLDPARQAQSYALLGALQRSGATMIIVTHDVNLLGHLHRPERIRVVGMKDGRTAFELPFRDDRLCAALTDLYGVPMQQFSNAGALHLAPAAARLP